MKLDLKADGLKGKQTPVVIVLIAVVVLALGFFVYKTFLSGSGDAPVPAEATASGTDPAMAGAPPAPPGPIAPPPGPGAPPATPGAPAPAAPAAPAAQPAPAGAKAAPAQPAPNAAAPKPAATPAAAKPGQPVEAMRTMTVYGSVTVSYPSKWGLDIRSASSAAIFTDGKGCFEVHAPDPKANNAKSIADSALKALGASAKVAAQGATKIAGQDAYWYAVNAPGGTMRIVGVDAKTRVFIVERMKSGQFASYRATFDKMQNALAFK